MRPPYIRQILYARTKKPELDRAGIKWKNCMSCEATSPTESVT